MDKTLTLKLKDWKNAINSLEEILKENKRSAIYRDSAISG